MAGERVRTDWDSMRTADPEGLRRRRRRLRRRSTIVNGDVPRPPRRLLREGVPRGRRRPAALPHAVQDPPRAGRRRTRSGRSSAREHRTSTASAQNPVEFPEIESTTTRRRRSARRRAATAATPRPAHPTTTCARARTSSSMARTRPGTTRRKQRALSRSGCDVAQAKQFHPEAPSLDDLVFLPANLSRLVIDPYRDACRVATQLGAARLELACPFLVAGLRRRARPRSRGAIGHGARDARPGLRRPQPARRGRSLAAARGRRRGRARPGGGRA